MTSAPKSGWLQPIATMPIEEVREILKRSGMPPDRVTDELIERAVPLLTNVGKALSADLS